MNKVSTSQAAQLSEVASFLKETVNTLEEPAMNGVFFFLEPMDEANGYIDVMRAAGHLKAAQRLAVAIHSAYGQAEDLYEVVKEAAAAAQQAGEAEGARWESVQDIPTEASIKLSMRK